MLDTNEENVDAKKSSTEVKAETTPQTEETTTPKVEATAKEESEEAVKEIDENLAEDSVKETVKEEIPTKDYESMDLETLVAEFKELLKNHPVQNIKTQAEGIKSSFLKKFGAILAEKKAAFLEEGGNSIDFQFSSPVKTEFNKLVSEYKKKRDKYYGDLEKQYGDNLEKKLKVIEDLKLLIQEAKPSTMYKEFRELQNVWRSVGPIAKSRYNDTWRTYQHHVERFYDLLHLSNDFRDLDFKKNLEEKLKLIERVEELVKEEDINVAFKELQKLHKEWKEDIGPVSKEMREEVWQKFSAATKKIHDRRHEHFRELKSKYSEIIEAKEKVIEEINNYDASGNQTHNDWQKSIKEIEAMRQKYFDAGKLPYSKSEAVWQKFKAATRKFNQAKNAFYKNEKSGQQVNLKKKLALIETAEELKDSEDWEIATETFKQIQAEWKKIGHVPRKFSDDIWKKFKSACNHYFDRYHAQKNALSKDQIEIVEKKKAFLETVKKEKKATKESVLSLMEEWSKLGSLPRNARQVDVQFNKEIDKLLGGLSLEKDEITMLKFRNIVDGYLANNDVRKLDSEQNFLRKKIDETEREISQLDNNLNFFSDTSESNPLVKNVKDRIENFREELKIWKQKLAYMRKLEY